MLQADKQTLQDLTLWDRDNPLSILNLFNKAETPGGREKLIGFFRHSLSSGREISERVELLRYFQEKPPALAIDSSTCDFVEFYLKDRQTQRSAYRLVEVVEGFLQSFRSSRKSYVVSRGTQSTMEVVLALNRFAGENADPKTPIAVRSIVSALRDILHAPSFSLIISKLPNVRFNRFETAQVDFFLRGEGREHVSALLDILYQVDAYASISRRGLELGFQLPRVGESIAPNVTIKGLFHPLVSNPVANDVSLTPDQNVCFVTGSNMSGKSTLLKAIGISLFLSQRGFPVPASFMETTVFKYLFSTINLPDNLHSGYSHFYNEVLRIKETALKLREDQHSFVIFDELFRGTNVKDAYDASLAVISAFSKIRNALFVVSTHIVEVAHELEACEKIDFQYMEMSFDKDRPKYAYRLKKGITDEKVGLWMIKNEGILEILDHSDLKKSC